MDEVPKVRCTDCGFLCLWTHDGLADEANIDYRKRGYIPDRPRIGRDRFVRRGEFRPAPFCLVAASDLRSEMAKATAEEGYRVASAERDCSAFRKWNPVRSAKEHHDMQIMEDALRREWEQRQQERRDDRRFSILLAMFAAALAFCGALLVQLLAS